MARRQLPAHRQCVKDLVAAISRLEQSKGRVARRNARRLVAGAIRSLKLRVNQTFPPIEKPDKAKPAKPARAKATLMSRHAYRPEGGKLFLRICKDVTGVGAESIEYGKWAGGSSLSGSRRLYLDTRGNQWANMIDALAGDDSTLRDQIVVLYNRFHVEVIAEASIELMAEHHEYLLKTDRNYRRKFNEP